MIAAARVAKLPPLVKLSLWAAAVVVISALVHLVGSALGTGFSIFEKSTGGTAVTLIAFGALLALMATDNRPAADYGLVADAKWKSRGLSGLAIGVAFYSAYLAFSWWAGVTTLHPESTSATQWAKAALSGWSGPAVAVAQQIIFSGYLLSTLRDRHSRLVAVTVPALLLAVGAGLTTQNGILSYDGKRLVVGMFLIQALLGMLRLRTGSIVLPAGLLAGCILVRKFAAKSHLINADWDSPNLWWVAPHGDPRRGLAMWLLLGLAAVGVAVVLWRSGERKIEADAAVDASFKRHMPFSNLLGLATFERWVALLWQSGLRVGPAYLPRLAISLTGSITSTLLALPERLIAPLVLRRDAPPPVFIVGMPRSGTTHLHNLLALDPQFRSPRNYEVFNPFGFLTGWPMTALLTPFLTWRRPMDAVQMTIFSAQEEEFALAAMGAPSPYWGFCFPRELDRHDRYWFSSGFKGNELDRWESSYKLFLRKLTCWRLRTPLLKNPANTGRVALLRRLFPGAKFVHIVRHPHAVWRSNQRFAEHGIAVFQLQDFDPADNYATRSLGNYRRLMDAYYSEAEGLADDENITVRFEDLESSPQETIESLYARLGLEVTPAFRAKLSRYLESVSGYRKNRFAGLAEEDRKKIDEAMAPYLAKWGYDQEAQGEPRAA